MTNEIMKFNYNSSHNNFPAIESLNPIDIGTERQFRFTTQMLCDMFQVAKNTVYNRIETLTNTGDLSVQNFEQIKIPIIHNVLLIYWRNDSNMIVHISDNSRMK